MMGNAGFDEYTSFIPKRDKTKENSNVLLYLHSESDRTSAVDSHYMKINEDGSIYWYCYDEESEEHDQNDENLAGMYPDYMPTVSDSDLEKSSPSTNRIN